jgi:hypothetical protein
VCSDCCCNADAHQFEHDKVTRLRHALQQQKGTSQTSNASRGQNMQLLGASACAPRSQNTVPAQHGMCNPAVAIALHGTHA